MRYQYALLLEDGNWHMMDKQEDNLGVMRYMAERAGGLGYRIFLHLEKIEEVIYDRSRKSPKAT